MACGCAGNNPRRQTFRTPASQTSQGQAAAQAGAGTSYEVLNARGAPTGRRFTSLVAATGYARNIGGSTRPV